MVASALGSTKPQPCLSFWRAAATAEQTPAPCELSAQQAAWPQSLSATQPPVMNCSLLPLPTLEAPALLGVTRARVVAATRSKAHCQRVFGSLDLLRDCFCDYLLTGQHSSDGELHDYKSVWFMKRRRVE
jgi:hypothetical protein